ncbi:MAG TPA: sensor histidine kinase [Miltoncostaeaceae bacterium]|nr:sensor histidine kinase [Miltoncostaeaceae bacterium]
MPGAADMPAQDAVSALVEVATCDANPSDGDAAVAALTEAARRAAGARIALAWAAGATDRDGRAAASAGLADGEAQRIGALLQPVLADAGEEEVMPGDDGPLAAALAGLGAPAALAIPLGTDGAGPGVLLLADASPPAAEPLRREAARLGARRIGAVLDAIRLRGNLERAMAQILEKDERLVGRIALDIHDGPTQQLSVALLEVQLLEADLADAEQEGAGPPDSLRPSLERIYETVGGALHEMRELIGHLRPAQFEDRRLPDILQDAITAFEARGDCRVEATWEGEFPANGVPSTQRITLYRILQESLTNAHRHGHASLVTVFCRDEQDGTRLVVTDDGRGFDPDAVQRRRPGVPLQRFGLYGMRERARMLEGTFDVTSAPGRGTTISVFLPRWEVAPPDLPVDAG